MDDIVLPTGMRDLIKAATRDLILACGGPAGVKAVITVSDGQISKWKGDIYEDLIPAWAVAMLEHHCQQPAFTRMMADLTGHRLVPIAEGGGEPDMVDVIGDVVKVTGGAGKIATAIADAISPNSPGGVKVTPGEYRNVLAVAGEHQANISRTMRHLAVVASGAA